MFVGSVSSLFMNQMLADIYLSFVWTAAGELMRIAHICITHGLSVVVVQRGVCPAPGVVPNQWTVSAQSLVLISVTDHGPQHMNIPGAWALLPNMQPALPQLYHYVNGAVVATKPVPWHHRVTLERTTKGTPLHYHQHARRRDHGPESPPILPQNEGTYKSFKRLVFSTQVQNCRRIQQ